MISEFWKLVEPGPSRPPFRQAAAVLFEVTSAEVKRKEARDNWVWVVCGTSCEPFGGIELLVPVEPIDYKCRPPELGNHW